MNRHCDSLRVGNSLNRNRPTPTRNFGALISPMLDLSSIFISLFRRWRCCRRWRRRRGTLRHGADVEVDVLQAGPVQAAVAATPAAAPVELPRDLVWRPAGWT